MSSSLKRPEGYRRASGRHVFEVLAWFGFTTIFNSRKIVVLPITIWPDDKGVIQFFAEAPPSIEPGKSKKCPVGDPGYRHLAKSTILAVPCYQSQLDQDGFSGVVPPIETLPLFGCHAATVASRVRAMNVNKLFGVSQCLPGVGDDRTEHR